MVQAAAKVMVEKKVSNGSIINISSIEAKVYMYCVRAHACTLACALWVCGFRNVLRTHNCYVKGVCIMQPHHVALIRCSQGAKYFAHLVGCNT